MWKQLIAHFPMCVSTLDPHTAKLAQSALMLRCPHPVMAEVCEFLCGSGDQPWRVRQPLKLRAVCKAWRDRIDKHCISHLSIKYEHVSPTLGLTTSQRDRLHRSASAGSSILQRAQSLQSIEIEPVEPSLIYSASSPFRTLMSNLALATHISLRASQHGLDEAGFIKALGQIGALQHCTSATTVSAAKLAMGSEAVSSLLSQFGSAVNAAPMQSLDISANNLNRSGRDTLQALTLPRFSKLQTLNMRGNWIGASGARELARVSASIAQLRHLNVQSCCLDRQGSHCIAVAMKSWPMLQHLDLCNNFLSFRAAQELAPALAAAAYLRTLVLSRNAIGNASISVLSRDMRNNESLEHLFLERCSLDDGCSDTLASLLERLPRLQSLSLSDNAFSHRTVEGMSRALQGMHDLQSLSLRHCGIMDEGLRALCHSLRNARDLKTLDIGSNSVSGNGIDSITLLHPDCRLRELNNRMNPIGSGGMVALSRWLQSNGGEVTRLQLSWNSLDGDGCTAFVQAIPFLHKLVELVLVGNVIGDEACTALLDTLTRSKAGRTLQLLDLSWNNLTDAIEGPLKRSIKRLPALHTLRIASNFLSPPAQRRLLQAGKARQPPLLAMTLPL